jgi:hypothetical protein
MQNKRELKEQERQSFGDFWVVRELVPIHSKWERPRLSIWEKS